MDSLLFLSARHVVTHHPLPALPDDLYPVLFKAAFLDGRHLVLRDLVAAWPFTELNFQRLLGCSELLWDQDCIPCILAVIRGVVVQLQQELEEPGLDSSLRVLDMTGLPAGFPISFSTKALAEACVELSKHQQEFQRRGFKRHKGCSGDATPVAAPQPPGVNIHTDLSVNEASYVLLFDALQAGATGPLRLMCREFKAKNLSACEIVTLLEFLDPSCLQRAELCCNDLGFTELLAILLRLSHFLELRSLKLQDENEDMCCVMMESDSRIRHVAKCLGRLPNLRELKLELSLLCGNLRQILGNLQTPLESLELDKCGLVLDDLAFLSQSSHAPALKKLHLSDYEVCIDFLELLEPLRLLLEKASASLLSLNLSYSDMDDSHLHALLPTLLRCSRLRFLGLYSKSLSTAALKDLLQKTLELPDLHQVMYPIPWDCYNWEPPESRWDFVVDRERLAVARAEFSQVLANSGRINLVWTDKPSGHRDLEYLSL